MALRWVLRIVYGCASPLLGDFVGKNAAWPSLWNSPSVAQRRPEMTLHTFKRQLKACLFHIWCVDFTTARRRSRGIFVISDSLTILNFKKTSNLACRLMTKVLIKTKIRLKGVAKGSHDLLLEFLGPIRWELSRLDEIWEEKQQI